MLHAQNKQVEKEIPYNSYNVESSVDISYENNFVLVNSIIIPTSAMIPHGSYSRRIPQATISTELSLTLQIQGIK
jgi:hypothetical protein